MGVFYVPVAPIGEIADGTLKSVDLNGRRVLVGHLQGEYFAFPAECPHEGANLDDGELRAGTITCRNHDYCYDLRTGECVIPADGPRLAVLPVEERDGQICIRLEW